MVRNGRKVIYKGRFENNESGRKSQWEICFKYYETLNLRNQRNTHWKNH